MEEHGKGQLAAYRVVSSSLSLSLVKTIYPRGEGSQTSCSAHCGKPRLSSLFYKLHPSFFAYFSVLDNAAKTGTSFSFLETFNSLNFVLRSHISTLKNIIKQRLLLNFG